MVKLSIIIPAYNAEPYIYGLIDILKPQTTKEVEIIIVDDGSRTPVKDIEGIRVIRQENKGASAARNKGLDEAKGEYISFIDADDLVSETYIQTILDKIEQEHFDYCYMSWQTFGTGWKYQVQLKSIEDRFPPFNLCVWNRVYKKDMIGSIRFNEHKAIAEDAQFIRDVKEAGKKKAFISECLYFYRTGHGGNLSARFNDGDLDFERAVINYKKITKDMEWLIDDVKELNETKEVIILTEQNEIPELEEYAMVIQPRPLKATELLGEKTNLVQIIPKPIRTQVVMYIANAHAIGGVETFIYNFCVEMKEYYDITVIYSEHMDALQIVRLAEHVAVMRNPNKAIFCDTLISNRITDDVPKNIHYKHKVQMCHTCQMKENYQIKKGWDDIVFVSQVAADSFKEQAPEYKVIPNLTIKEKPKKTLLLVSAQRMTYEKGEKRIIELAEKLRHNNIPFLWVIFTKAQLSRHIPGVVVTEPTLDARSFFKKADYVVCLSDIEAFGYTLVEAMELGVPVLTTPISVLEELDFMDGIDGWIVPFDIKDADVNKYYNQIPKPKKRKSQNAKIIQQWRELLGAAVPTHSYEPYSDFIRVVITKPYGDLELGRNMMVGEVVTMRRERALLMIQLGNAEMA